MVGEVDVAWQPLSVRMGMRPPDEPYEGVPPHLKGRLISWLYRNLNWSEAIREVIMYARVPAPYHPDSMKALNSTISLCSKDDDVFLDLLDASLNVRLGDDDARESLREILAAGGSTWTVSPDGKSLQRAVQPESQAAFEQATSTADTASDELTEAWSKAYGRDPDASDAWDHSIKAIEAVLRPIVCPNNKAATLSNVIGELRAQPWKLNVPGRARDNSVLPLISMLELMWPEPNRHGSPTPEPPATLDAARAVVQLAVAIVQWGRDGQIARR
jgi:hypothetical protein